MKTLYKGKEKSEKSQALKTKKTTKKTTNEEIIAKSSCEEIRYVKPQGSGSYVKVPTELIRWQKYLSPGQYSLLIYVVSRIHKDRGYGYFSMRRACLEVNMCENVLRKNLLILQKLSLIHIDKSYKVQRYYLLELCNPSVERIKDTLPKRYKYLKELEKEEDKSKHTSKIVYKELAFKEKRISVYTGVDGVGQKEREQKEREQKEREQKEREQKEREQKEREQKERLDDALDDMIYDVVNATKVAEEKDFGRTNNTKTSMVEEKDFGRINNTKTSMVEEKDFGRINNTKTSMVEEKDFGRTNTKTSMVEEKDFGRTNNTKTSELNIKTLENEGKHPQKMRVKQEYKNINNNKHKHEYINKNKIYKTKEDVKGSKSEVMRKKVMRKEVMRKEVIKSEVQESEVQEVRQREAFCKEKSYKEKSRKEKSCKEKESLVSLSSTEVELAKKTKILIAEGVKEWVAKRASKRFPLSSKELLGYIKYIYSVVKHRGIELRNPPGYLIYSIENKYYQEYLEFMTKQRSAQEKKVAREKVLEEVKVLRRDLDKELQRRWNLLEECAKGRIREEIHKRFTLVSKWHEQICCEEHYKREVLDTRWSGILYGVLREELLNELCESDLIEAREYVLKQQEEKECISKEGFKKES